MDGVAATSVAAVLQRLAAPNGLVEEVTPCLRIARSEPPRGLEPRPPHYERGVLPVELWRQEYGENHVHEEGLLLCH